MQLKHLFQASAIAAALALVGCGGDINITEGSIDNSVTNNYEGDSSNGGSSSGDNSTLPGDASSFLSTQVSTALGQDVEVRTLSGTLTSDDADENGNIVLTNDTVWAIEGALFIGEDNAKSVNLVIEEGAIVFGRDGADYLVVSRGSKIEAVGTADAPIIFTSYQDVVGDEVNAGQWGGIVLLGNAPSNRCPTDGSDCALQVEGVEEGAVFGGTDETDNSGTLNYVVVKYAGYEIAVDNELNGITFGGVGSGTKVDYVQVHANADDGVEFFGGNVTATHLVLTSNEDDSVDWDNGFKGKLQYVFIQHNTSDGDANRGIEADNDGSEPDIEPQSNPIISNLTIIGNNFDGEDDSEGVYLREGTGAQIYNMVITGPSGMGECFEVENSTESQANLADGTITVANSVIACGNDENFKSDIDNGATDLQDWFVSVQSDNQILSSSAILLSSTGKPLADSPLLGAGYDVTAVDTALEANDFIGAVGETDWRQGWAFGFGGGTIQVVESASGCPTGTSNIASIDGTTTTCSLSGTLSDDVTLTAGNIYALSGAVFVGGDNENSATLTIEPGVTVYGASGNDYLVVSRGSEIDAEGTAAQPIVFTSYDDVVSDAGEAGQWGGLVLLGNAPSNRCPTDGSDCALQIEGVEEGAVFGGTDETDSSGTLRYVRVQFGGYEIAVDNELNGITFGGVGSGTTVDHIQVHANADDGVEFFGGNVDVKYMVLTNIQDDSMDWDNGFKGRFQYVLVRQATDNSDANRGIEADNDGSNPAAEPQSNPSLANVTIIGNNFDGEDDSEGVYLREGTGAQLSNFIIAGPAGMGECFEVENSTESQLNLSDDTITFSNSVIACENGESFKSDTANGAVDLEDWFLNTQTGNSVETASSAALNGIYSVSTVTPKDFTGDQFFDTVDYVGAVKESDDWTAGWTIGLE